MLFLAIQVNYYLFFLISKIIVLNKFIDILYRNLDLYIIKFIFTFLNNR